MKEIIEDMEVKMKELDYYNDPNNYNPLHTGTILIKKRRIKNDTRRNI